MFKLPSRKIDSDWKKNLVDIIKKYRVVDSEFQKRIDQSKVWICGKHFKDSDFEFTLGGTRRPKLNALPSVNLKKIPKIHS